MRPRRVLLALVAAPPLAGWARAPRMKRVGVLGNAPAYVQSTEWRAFVDDLARQGFVEGLNLEFVHRYAGTYVEPEATTRMRRQAQELVQAGVDLIYAVDDGSSATSAQQVTRTVSIVFDRAWRDPVALGLVAMTRHHRAPGTAVPRQGPSLAGGVID